MGGSSDVSGPRIERATASDRRKWLDNEYTNTNRYRTADPDSICAPSVMDIHVDNVPDVSSIS
jgi:hypothetical protein